VVEVLHELRMTQRVLHHMPAMTTACHKGGTEADRGVTGDQSDGATREPTEGHPMSAEGHSDEV
jgi:hypothetical protein